MWSINYGTVMSRRLSGIHMSHVMAVWNLCHRVLGPVLLVLSENVVEHATEQSYAHAFSAERSLDDSRIVVRNSMSLLIRTDEIVMHANYSLRKQ